MTGGVCAIMQRVCEMTVYVRYKLTIAIVAIWCKRAVAQPTFIVAIRLGACQASNVHVIAASALGLLLPHVQWAAPHSALCQNIQQLVVLALLAFFSADSFGTLAQCITARFEQIHSKRSRSRLLACYYNYPFPACKTSILRWQSEELPG